MNLGGDTCDMEQLEFEFVRKRYDIFSDTMIPVNSLAIGALHWAYGQIRQAVGYAKSNDHDTLPVTVLDVIHDRLKDRLRESN